MTNQIVNERRLITTFDVLFDDDVFVVYAVRVEQPVLFLTQRVAVIAQCRRECFEFFCDELIERLILNEIVLRVDVARILIDHEWR